MDDAESIDNFSSKKNSDGSLWSVLLSAMGSINAKNAIFIFLIFAILNSDLFFTTVLERMDGATELKQTTTYGVCIQGIFMALAYIIIDILVRQEII